MADVAPPRTPTPTSATGRKSRDEASMQSPAPIGTMTPPPSDRKSRPRPSSSSSSAFAAPPPAPAPAVPATPSRHSRNASMGSGGGGLGAASPTPEQIQNMSEEELRMLVTELVPAFGEARMELAHIRLQFQLLSMESQEQAQMAEVEHDMTRKELEILQAGSPMIQSRAIIHPDPRSSLAHAQRQLGEAVEFGRHLEEENGALEQRLKDAKRVIKYLDGQVFDLKEHNKMLRERVRTNREHLNAMRAAGLIHSGSSSPRASGAHPSSRNITHYATPARPRKQLDSLKPNRNSQLITPNTARPQDDPFGALLFAGEVLDAQHQRASVPSTPSPTRAMRQPPGHTRGTLSLSSLPVTPRVAQFAPINISTPVQQQHQAQYRQNQHQYQHQQQQQAVRGRVGDKRGRRGSASTISDSQESSRHDFLASRAAALDDESLTDDDNNLPSSQASRAASELLKKPAAAAKYRQTKITGQVVKNASKRVHSGTSDFDSPKKQKTTAASRADVGLGIGMWPSPAR